MLLRSPQDVVRRQEPIGRRGEAAIALEARADQALVGQVGAREQARDALEERGLGERPGRRQEAVHGPLDAVGEGHGRRVAVRSVAEPPAVAFDAHEALPVHLGERLSHEAHEAIDRIGGRASRRRGIGRRVVDRSLGRGVRRGGPPEATQMAGPVQPDEHLTQQTVRADRLAADLEHLDDGLDDRGRGGVRVVARVRPVHRGREQAASGAGCRGRPQHRAEARAACSPACEDHRAHPRPAAGARRGHPYRSPAPAGVRQAADSRRCTPPRTAAIADSDPSPSTRSTIRASRPRSGWMAVSERAEGGGLPAPRRSARDPEQRLERQGRCGFAAEGPGRRVIGPREPVGARAQRRRAQDEPDPWPIQGACECLRLQAQRPVGGRRGLLEDDRRRTLAEAPQVLAQACRHGSVVATFQALDEAAHETDAILEREPRVPLPPRRAARRLELARDDPGRHRAAGARGEPAGRRDGMEERETQRRRDGRGTQIALDPFEDRARGRRAAAGCGGRATPRRDPLPRPGRGSVREAGRGSRRLPRRSSRGSHRTGRGRPGVARHRRSGRDRPGSGNACGPASTCVRAITSMPEVRASGIGPPPEGTPRRPRRGRSGGRTSRSGSRTARRSTA